MKFIYPFLKKTVCCVSLLSSTLLITQKANSQATTCASTFTQCLGQQETFTGGANGFTSTNGFAYSNNALRVASTSPNTDFTINSRVYTLSTMDVINVGFNTAGTTANISSYRVEVINAANGNVIASCANPSSPTIGPICYTITDTDLDLGLQVIYRITIRTAGGNNATIVFDNFTFLEIQQSPLPIHLKNFSVTKTNNTVSVNWQTVSETNCKGFEVQRKTAGGDFQAVAFVPSQAAGGNSSVERSYEFTETHNFKGNTFYRVKQLDNDGRATYTETKLLKGDKATANISAYPNPVTNSLTIEGAMNNRVRLIDVNGRTVIERLLKEDLATIDVIKLAPGLYTLQISDLNQVIRQIKIIKQ